MRATREAKKGQTMSLFDTYEGKEGDTFEAGWRNKLIWGDNLLVMGSLLEKFAGEVDLIYIDPPFATGVDFSFAAAIGDTGQEVTKKASSVEEKAYRDTWGAGVKYARFRGKKTRAGQYLERMAKARPGLFAHWHCGMTGVFA